VHLRGKVLIFSLAAVLSSCGFSSLSEHKTKVLQSDLNYIAAHLQEYFETSQYSNDLILTNSPAFEIELPEIIQKSKDSLHEIERGLKRLETDLNLYGKSLPNKSRHNSLGSKDARKLLEALKQWQHYQGLNMDIANSCLDFGDSAMTCMENKALDFLYYENKSREKVDKLGDLFRKFDLIE
jgi:hypothetical protein